MVRENHRVWQPRLLGGHHRAKQTIVDDHYIGWLALELRQHILSVGQRRPDHHLIAEYQK